MLLGVRPGWKNRPDPLLPPERYKQEWVERQTRDDRQWDVG